MDYLRFLIAFIRARWGYRFKTREQLRTYQEKRIAKLMRTAAHRTKFYKSSYTLPFLDLPIVGKADMLASFARFNSSGIDLETARSVAVRAERDRDFSPMLPGGITVGCSSGTSGAAGVFLVSSRERAVWAGTILARMLSSNMLRRILAFWAPRLRIAFFLRANSNLYKSIGSRRVDFRFFDMLSPPDRHAAELSNFKPDILIVPASVLGHLAGMQQAAQIVITPSQVISVAETLEPAEAGAIRAAWGISPQQIYQCTEGFLGYSCEQGSLHLNEEFIKFEAIWLDDDHTRFAAVVTDFSRTTQLFVRFRMDDVLHVGDRFCSCGRVTRQLSSIEGRQDEVLWLSDLKGGELKPVFPDQLRRAMVLAIPQTTEYQLRQSGDSLEISFPEHLGGNKGGDLTDVRREISHMCQQLGLRIPQIGYVAWSARHPIEKRRRIVRS